MENGEDIAKETVMMTVLIAMFVLVGSLQERNKLMVILIPPRTMSRGHRGVLRQQSLIFIRRTACSRHSGATPGHSTSRPRKGSSFSSATCSTGGAARRHQAGPRLADRHPQHGHRRRPRAAAVRLQQPRRHTGLLQHNAGLGAGPAGRQHAPVLRPQRGTRRRPTGKTPRLRQHRAGGHGVRRGGPGSGDGGAAQDGRARARGAAQVHGGARRHHQHYRHGRAMPPAAVPGGRAVLPPARQRGGGARGAGRAGRPFAGRDGDRRLPRGHLRVGRRVLRNAQRVPRRAYLPLHAGQVCGVGNR
ncbi:hypothetical protein VPH35_015966 [Triticum aestivum]